MKNTLLIALILLSFQNISAQSRFRSFKGRVVDSATFQPIPDATISIFNAKDSLLLNFGFTTPNGNFTLNTTSSDSVFVTISIVNYYEKTFFEPGTESGWRFQNYGDIKLNKLPLTLKGFTVRSSAIRMNGDTIEINASRFKVMPGSDVAQLFKKIPGFEISVKGEIKVNGADVNKITVDGSDFFGNNPGMVSKNLSADMIETVQVFEERNEDGSPKDEASQVINLKLKKGKRNGTFGDFLAGYGTNDRYEGGIRLNNFKNDRKLSFIVNSNNTNETGFDFGFKNWHNANRVDRNGDPNDGMFYYNGGNTGEGNINNKTGAGLTYFNEFKGKRKVSANFFVDRNKYNSISASKSFNGLNDSTERINIDSNSSNGLVTSGSMELTMSKEIDSTGYYDIGLTANIRDNSSNIQGINEIRLNQTVLNSGNSETQNENLSNSLKLSSSFRKVARKTNVMSSMPPLQ
ncbi:MAG: hypothetical protein R2852_05215 [Bacteroidia bacterium]